MSDGYPSLNAPRAFPLPTISEDTLHYALHLSTASSNEDAAAFATVITAYVNSLLTQPWLWNKDAWELKVASASQLGGTMRVGDAVDDEWLVVWLLREVSRHWPDLVISVRDSDGEFLLIEAAHELPGWVTPENAENRLWLMGGHLHLLPLSVRSDSTSKARQIGDEDYDRSGRAVNTEAKVTESDAVAAVRTGKYPAPAGVEQAVWKRISSYPAALKTHQHRAKAYLPVPVARALRMNPELIQRAVEGFYVRDPAQLRAASRMTHFPPSPAVLSSVLLTRAAYAQLQGQVFHPPRVFGAEWHVREGEGEDERRWRDLGVKIATGFEIMYREGGKKGRVADAKTSTADLDSDPAYAQYLSSLKKAGFFGDEMEGSARWKERAEQAAKGWIEARSSDTQQRRPSFAYLVDQAIEESKNVPADHLQAGPNSPEDSDEWLEVDPQELDAMLMRAAGESKEDDVDLGEDGKELQDLASKLEQFVGGEGDLQGARFADELSDEDMDSDSEEEEEPTAAQKEERLRTLVPNLPAEEWGRKEEAKDVQMAAAEPRRQGTVAGSAAGDAMLPPKMRPPMFEKIKYDGVESDSSDEDDEEDLPAPGSLGRRIAEMKWAEGAPREAQIEELSDDEKDGDAEDRADRARARTLKLDEDLDAHMQRRVWGDDDKDEEDEEDEGMDVDMDDEQADFLKFSRDALGIDDEMWEDILASRRARGAFVPSAKQQASKPSEPKAVEEKPVPVPEQERTPNMALNSFESMMAAMEAELERSKGSQPAAEAKPKFVKPAKKAHSADSTPSSKPKSKTLQKGKGKAKLSLATLPSEADLDDMDEDDLAAMDAELRAALEEADDGGDLDIPEGEGLEGAAAEDYRMMRDLLESYRSQGGKAGVVGNLFGRLGANK